MVPKIYIQIYCIIINLTNFLDDAQKRVVPKIYIQVYCVIINLTNLKHDAQNKIGLNISISKLNFVKFVSYSVKSQLPSC
jgi:hypothetical protein